MICPPCRIQMHEGCQWPHSCPCAHVPSEDVQIVQEQELEQEPLDMDALNRMFSSTATIKLR
jgi:hypothetical protein